MTLSRIGVAAAAIVFVVSLAGDGLAQEEGTKPYAVLLPTAPVRQGIHHAGIEVRIVDPDKKPVSGARVVVFADPKEAGSDPWPLARAISDAAGKAKFPSLSTPSGILIRAEPPERYQPAVITATLADGRLNDLGDLQLALASRFSGAIEVVGGDGPPPALEGVVRLLTKTSNQTLSEASAFETSVTQATATLDLGRFVMECGAATEGFLEVTLTSPTPNEIYRASIKVEPGVLDRRVVVRCDRATLKDDRESILGRFGRRVQNLPKRGKAELVEQPPAIEKPMPRTIEGRLLLPDGTPVGGARVRLEANLAYGDPGDDAAYATTDNAGKFTVVGRLGAIEGLSVVSTVGRARFPIAARAGGSGYAGGDKKFAGVEDCALAVKGAGDRKPEFAYLAHGQWVPADATQFGRVLRLTELGFGQHETGLPLVVRATLPGHLPEVAIVTEAAAGAALSFEGRRKHSLRVTAGGKPLKGALVDVELVRETSDSAPEWAAPTRLDLGSHKTDDKGALELLGNPEAHYEVFVHAPGHRRVAARWTSAVPANLTLVPESLSVKIEGLKPYEVYRVVVAGTEEVVQVGTPTSATLALAPGRYEWFVFDLARELVRGGEFTVENKGPKSVSFGKDQRPALRIALPAGAKSEDWSARATRGPAPGAAGNWFFGNYFSMRSADRDDPALGREPGRLVLLLSGTGRHHVEIVHRRRPNVSFLRVVEVVAGKPAELRMPAPDAKLQGKVSEILGGGEFGPVMLAAPRLYFASANPEAADAFDVSVGAPTLGQNATFEVSVPPGEYYLHHHLGTTPGFGGWFVNATASETTALDDVTARERGALRVQVTDAKGKAATVGTIRVRDRMVEAWEAYVREPSSFTSVSLPLPPPPRFPLTGEPVTFGSLVGSRLELDVELPDGTLHRFRINAAFDETVRLELPAVATPK